MIESTCRRDGLRPFARVAWVAGGSGSTLGAKTGGGRLFPFWSLLCAYKMDRYLFQKPIRYNPYLHSPEPIGRQRNFHGGIGTHKIIKFLKESRILQRGRA